MAARLRKLLSGYPSFALVIVAAVIGLSVRTPFSWALSHQGVNVLLVVLVFATAVTIDAKALRSLSAAWPTLLAALLAGVTVLPALSWLASRVVAAGSLRDGILCVGLAPCEIASVATTTMAGGAAALSAGVLIGSTVATVVVAGPVLSLEVGQGSTHPGHLVVNLTLVVVLPLVAGIGLARWRPMGPGEERTATVAAMLAVAALVALVASEVHLSVRYLAVLGALAIFLAGSAVLGWVLGRGDGAGRRPVAIAVLLTTSMRDFAIAAGIAADAFGSAAAAPLGAYGVAVLVWGTALAGVLRSRALRPS